MLLTKFWKEKVFPADEMHPQLYYCIKEEAKKTLKIITLQPIKILNNRSTSKVERYQSQDQTGLRKELTCVHLLTMKILIGWANEYWNNLT